MGIFPLLTLSFFLVASQRIYAEVLPSAEESIGRVKDWSKSRLREAEQSFANSGLAREKSLDFWGTEIVYQIQVDRFNDGDPSNNVANISDIQRDFQSTTQKGIPDYRHGGDLAGIIQRLDYLKELGIGSIWITPVFKNQNASYHNYCTSDFTQIDPAFGTNELFREFVAQAHRRGIKVILDIVVNHICSKGTRYQSPAHQPANYGSCVNDSMNKYLSGNPQAPINGRLDIKFGDDFFPPLRNAAFLSRCGHKDGDSGSNGAGAVYGDFIDEMLDLETNNWDFQEIFTNIHKWWIAYADIDGFRMDAIKHVTADFTAKFATETRDYARTLGKKNFFVVGEAAGEIKYPGWELTSSLHLGKMQDAVVGESKVPQSLRARVRDLNFLYQSNPAWPHPGTNAVYDFSLSGTLARFWKREASALSFKHLFFQGADNQNFGRSFDSTSFADVMGNPGGMSHGYADMTYNGDPRLSWILLEIHDWPRFALGGQSYEQMISAMTNLLLTEGTPIIYYGYEQGFNARTPPVDRIQITDRQARAEVDDVLGNSSDSFDHKYHPRYRQDMFVSGPWRMGSTLPSVNQLSGVGYRHAEEGPRNWREDPFLRTDHELFQRIRGLSHLRQSCKALKYGKTYFRAAHQDGNGGLLAYSRIDSLAAKEVLVLANSSAHIISIGELGIDTSLARGRSKKLWKNALKGSELAWVKEGSNPHPGATLSFDDPDTADQVERFDLSPGAVAVFVDSENLTEFREDLGRVHLCKD